MINLATLIRAAPFDEETRQMILERLEKGELDEDQKLQMSSLCWEMIVKLYEAELSSRFDFMLFEQAEGKKKYEKNDFVEEKIKLIHKFAVSLESASSKEEIEKVRKKLEREKTG